MQLTLDIEKHAKRIIRSSKSAVPSDSAHLFQEKRMKGNVDDHLNSFILMTEGYQIHVTELDPAKVRDVLAQTQKVISIFDSLDEDHFLNKFSGDAEIQAKFKYALKTLYRLESLLHLATTKGLEVEKTPAHIKEGLANLSKQAIAKGLSSK